MYQVNNNKGKKNKNKKTKQKKDINGQKPSYQFTSMCMYKSGTKIFSSMQSAHELSVDDKPVRLGFTKESHFSLFSSCHHLWDLGLSQFKYFSREIRA